MALSETILARTANPTVVSPGAMFRAGQKEAFDRRVAASDFAARQKVQASTEQLAQQNIQSNKMKLNTAKLGQAARFINLASTTKNPEMETQLLNAAAKQAQESGSSEAIQAVRAILSAAPENRPDAYAAINQFAVQYGLTGETAAQKASAKASAEGVDAAKVQSSRLLDDGSTVLVKSDGAIEVRDPNQKLVVGAAAADVIKKANAEEVRLAQEKSRGRAQGKADVEEVYVPKIAGAKTTAELTAKIKLAPELRRQVDIAAAEVAATHGAEAAGAIEAAVLAEQKKAKPDIERAIATAKAEVALKHDPQIAGQVQMTKNAIASSEKMYEQTKLMRGNVRNLQKALTSMDDGAITGWFPNFFPSLRSSTQELNRVQKELGLDIVRTVTFGPLSKGELDLSLDVAMPKDMRPAALRSWIVNKIALQTELMDEMDKAARFIGSFNPETGRANTMKDWNDLQGQRVIIPATDTFPAVTQGHIAETIKQNAIAGHPKTYKETVDIFNKLRAN